ncbi:hypothetical protein BpHYR1_023017 [Brachionus plicatilis]|uniref:Uncharacterized protein n=1 Tax=Brachionus plicatilis TaxID=10195 RepID=A0A3M7QED3_BRAPC|nr:hypothetical protein BpHYR1_023017 [Brachionus plicatilis]
MQSDNFFTHESPRTQNISWIRTQKLTQNFLSLQIVCLMLGSSISSGDIIPHTTYKYLWENKLIIRKKNLNIIKKNSIFIELKLLKKYHNFNSHFFLFFYVTERTND